MNARPLLACSLLIPALTYGQTDSEAVSQLAGVGLRSRPAYDGSKSQRLDVVPILNLYGETLFTRTTQGILEAGARAELARGFHIGGQLAWEEGRRTRESSFLRAHNVPDLGPSLSLGAHVEADVKLGPMPLNLLARWRQDLRSDRGAQLDLRSTAGIYDNGPLAAAVFGQVTWASEKSVRTFYGQPGFNPSGGADFVSIGTYAGYDLSKNWQLIGSVESRRLRGDAAASPLSERRTNYDAVVGIAYRFPKASRGGTLTP